MTLTTLLNGLTGSGKAALGWMPVYRYCMFIFGASCPWVVGSPYTDAYRGFNDHILMRYFDAMYHSYFGRGYLKIFNFVKDDNGVEFPDYFHYCNVIFVELCLFFILWLSTKALSGAIAKGSKFGNLVGSLEWVNAFFFGFPYVGWAIFWFKQDSYISLANNGGATYNRKTFGYILGWIIAVFMVAVIFWDGFVGAVTIVLDYKKTLASNPKVYGQTNNREVYGQDTARTAFQHRPNGQTGGNFDSASATQGKGLTLDELAIEFLFMHQNPKVAAKHPIGIFYFSYFLNRWAWFAVLGIIWMYYPRTLYTGFVIVDIIMIGLTVASLGTFKGIAGPLILAEEILVFLWHFAQWLLFLDHGRENDQGGRGKFTAFWTKLFVYIVFGCYFLTIIIEIVLVFATLFGDNEFAKSGAPENLNAGDVALDAQSENNLEKKVSQFNNMKVEIARKASQLPAIN